MRPRTLTGEDQRGNLGQLRQPHPQPGLLQGAQAAAAGPGLDFAPQRDIRPFQAVLRALQTFHALHGHFDELSGTEQWPAETWGLKLGLRVKEMRRKGT